MSFWTSEGIKAACHGAWLARGREAMEPRGASIDTRTLKDGQIFFALRGERVDGHAYLDAAAAAGASIAVIDTVGELSGEVERFHGKMGVLKVEDVGAALVRLGGAARRALETTRVVSIGGSNGKTTTTRLVEGVLGTAMHGTASPKSFNNSIGVPLTLLNAWPGDAFVAAEVGTNAPGEIAELAEVVRPDVAVITSIGREHLEGLGSLEGVAREEAAILPSLASGGVAILNADAPHLMELARAMLTGRKDVSVVRFGWAEDAELRITEAAQGEEGLVVTLNGRERYVAPLLGRHNAWNVAAAVAVGKRFGLDSAAINAGLAKSKAAENRLARSTIGGVMVVNDAYNANPESMRAAIETFAEVAAGAKRRVMVLGDMLELGAEGAGLHAEVGAYVAERGAAEIAVFVGGLSEHGARALMEASPHVAVRHFAEGSAAVCEQIAAMLKPGDAVLLKGSRGMALERVAAAMAKRAAGAVVTMTPAGAKV